MASLEEHINQLSEQNEGTLKPHMAGIITGAGVAGGLLYAFVRRKGIMGYVGYGFLGLIIGGMAGTFFIKE